MTEYERLINLNLVRIRINLNIVDGGIPFILESTWQRVKETIHKIEQNEQATMREVGEATGDDGDGVRHNPVYDSAAQKYAILGSISKSDAIYIYVPGKDTDKVAVGCKVKLYFHEDGETEVYNLGSSWDAKMNRTFISITSPLGKAILGAKRGDTIRYRLENSTEEYSVTIKKIMEISEKPLEEDNG